MLHEFLTTHTASILARTRELAALRPKTPEVKGRGPTEGISLLLAQVIRRLGSTMQGGDPVGASASTYGGELMAMGFTVGQVVHGYGDVCQAVTSLADETHTTITADEFHTFNRCLDDAIAGAVTEFERQRETSIADEGVERMGFLAHELRNRLASATLSYNLLRAGTVAIGGSTGSVLGRSLRGMRDLVASSLAGVRLDSGSEKSQRVCLSELIGEVEAEAAIDATAGGFELAVSPVATGIDVAADPQILSAALANLLQNAFKFSRTHGRVVLRTSATADRVLLEVEDECGGLPPGKIEDLFRPFEQGSSRRPGLGLGLTISRRGVEAMGGRMHARDVPGRGCVFTIDLPRLPPA